MSAERSTIHACRRRDVCASLMRCGVTCMAVAGVAIAYCSTQAAYADINANSDALALVRAAEQARMEIIERVRPAVACVFNRGNRAGGGSGVIIDAEGYGLTNFHVIAGMLEDRAGDIGLPDGRIYEMEVLGIDPTGDMAMFRAVHREPFPTVELGDSDDLRVGDFTLAMGNPFLLAEDYTPTVTFGNISGIRRYQAGAGDKGRALRYTDCIQVDTSINPGNSGGPLFDLMGRLIGINGRVSIEERGRVNVGVGYAISINQIKRFIPMWRAGITTKHATAGFTTFDRGRSVIVDQILENGPAYAAGVQLGDEIVEFAGRRIESANQFASYLGVFPARWPVEMTCLRDGRTMRFRFRLEDLPLPKAPKEPSDPFGGKDLLGPSAVTEAANRRATKRAIRLYVESLGGADAVKQRRELRWSGRRVAVAPRVDADEPIEWTERREDIARPSRELTPIDMERAIRWSMMDAGADELRGRCRVEEADEVAQRIAVVLLCKLEDGGTYRAAFDDVSGELLRVEFKDAFSGKNVRYEYGGFESADVVRMPRERTLYLDDALHSREIFGSVTGE